MSILHLPMTLPDGRQVEFHAATEFHLDVSTNRMQIIVESYATEESARSNTMSSAKSVVDVPLPDWTPVYADNLLNFVTSDPGWSAAVVIS